MRVPVNGCMFLGKTILKTRYFLQRMSSNSTVVSFENISFAVNLACILKLFA